MPLDKEMTGTTVAELHEGMGVAVAERTILRPKYKETPPNKLVLNPLDPDQQKWYQLAFGSGIPVEYDEYVENVGRAPVRDVDFVFETWGDVAKRVAKGNVSLVSLPSDEAKKEEHALMDAIMSGTALMSGRHMQHGDSEQATRPMMVFTNCATAANSFSQFYLLLNGCFAAGTLVKMSNGAYKPIEKIYPGEMVYSYDEKKREYTVQQVQKLNVNMPKPLVKVEFDDGTSLVCTDDHKFLTKEGKWLKARNIEWNRIKSMTSEKTRLVSSVTSVDEHPHAVFDLTVANTHNYLVTKANLVAHNSGVGRSYDDDLMLVDWDFAPNVQCVISDEHKDYPWGGQFLSTREAKHRFNGGYKVHWFNVPDTREGWAQAIEYIEGMAYQKIYHDHLVVLDFSDVRPQGSPIKGMQGRVSSGPVPLMSAINKMMTIKGAGMERWKQAMFVDHYAAECVLVGGARRCLPKNYLVKMEGDEWKRISEIEEGDLVSVNGESYKVNAFYDNGVQYTVKVYTRNGRYHECTPEHKWYVYNSEKKRPEWVQAQYLNDSYYFIRQGSPTDKNVVILHDSLQIIEVKQGEEKEVCDIEVDEIHAFSARNPETDLESISHNSARMATKHWKDKSIFDFIQVKRPIEYYGLSVDEIKEFRITRTEQGLSPLQSFLWSSNNSVLVDDEFWELLNLKRGEDGYSSDWARHARRVFGLVTECSYGDGTGEPGFINSHKLRKNHTGLENIYNNIDPYIHSSKYQVHEDTEMYLRALVNRAKKKEHYMIVNPCVTGDTEVQTSDGKMTIDKLVKMYEIGDTCPYILSYNTQIDASEYKELKWAGMTQTDASIIHVTGIDGKSLRCTPDHRVWTINRGYVQAQFLQETDILIDSDGEVFSGITVTELSEVEDVYDITVKDNHNFYANGMLVHNCSEITLHLLGGFCVIGDLAPIMSETFPELVERAKAMTRALIRTNLMDSIYNKEVKRSNRIGVSLTGVHEWAWRDFKLSFRQLLDEYGEAAEFWNTVASLAKEIEAEAIRYSSELGLTKPHTALTIKPSGCLTRDTRIKTTNGLMSIEEIFKLNGLDTDSVERGFYELKEPISVYDMNNEEKQVTALFSNGESSTYTIDLEDGIQITCTPEHKFLTTDGWKHAFELTENDDIITH